MPRARTAKRTTQQIPRRSRAREFWDHLSYGAKTVTVIGAALGMLGAAYFAHTSQFAMAGDFEKYRKETTQQFAAQQQLYAAEFAKLHLKADVLGMQAELNHLEGRRAGLADKVYDLQARPNLSPGERASLSRYLADLDQITRDARDKKRLLDAMRGSTK